MFERADLGGAEDGVLLGESAGNEQGRLGEPITGIEEARLETTAREGGGKAPQGVGTDGLGAVGGRLPDAEGEGFALLRGDPAGAQVICEVGAAADGRPITRDRLEPSGGA